MLDHTRKEKIYAGVLGKIIGVYSGRPFENWKHETIEGTFGEINRYVNRQVNEPLVVADDDVTGTSMFLKSLEDHEFREDFSPKHVGQTWLDILIENKTVFWWGGYDMSTEHTAYLNLKNGIEAPVSGSIEQNGHTVAEQIGAQIFIDYWGLINPDNPDKAVELAKVSARVGHDGEAVYAATVIAAMVSMAFDTRDMNVLLDRALSYIPKDSEIARVIANVRSWHKQNPSDWRWAFSQLKEVHGYHKYGGQCHVVPNHGLIILSLLYGEESFHQSMVIVNTLGWDTDCNAANVGCINGVRLGLDNITEGYDWRSPVADRIYLPTASSCDNVTDAVQETNHLIRIAERLMGDETEKLPRFSFNYRGARQGFEVTTGQDYADRVSLSNDYGQGLKVHFNGLVKGLNAQVKTPTHTKEDEPVQRFPYHLVGSPTLYSGQKVDFVVSGCVDGKWDIEVTPFVITYDHQGHRDELTGQSQIIKTTDNERLSFVVPDVGSRQITYLGLYISNPTEGIGVSGWLEINSIDWSNTPTVCLEMPKEKVNQWWLSSFINTMSHEMVFGHAAALMNNTQGEKRVFVYGSEDFRDYTGRLSVTPLSNSPWGILFNYRGLSRNLEMRYEPDTGTMKLIRNHFEGEDVLAQAAFSAERGKTCSIDLKVSATRYRIAVDGQALFDVNVSDARQLDRGCIGVSNYFGAVKLHSVCITPMD